MVYKKRALNGSRLGSPITTGLYVTIASSHVVEFVSDFPMPDASYAGCCTMCTEGESATLRADPPRNRYHSF